MIFKNSYDVVVVGAGPAGSSTAKQCAELGLSVLLLEKRDEIGAPKRCGEGLSMNNEKKLGIKIPKNCISTEIDGAVVYAPNGKSIEIKSQQTKGYTLERKSFDKWLAAEAAKAGAKVVSKANVTDVIKNGRQVCGVKISYFDETYEIKSRVVVAADGVESMIMRKAGIRTNKKLNLVDSGFQYEMAGLKLKNPRMIELYFGFAIAPRGYVWVFPKGNGTANVGIGISGNSENKAKEYLDEYIESRPDLKQASILEVNAGCIPVGDLRKNMVGDGILGVGDAVNQVNPIHGGGIAESIYAGRIAGDVISNAIKKNDCSAKGLEPYNKLWWKERGNKLKKVEKVREMMENMTDVQMNNLADVLSGEDLAGLARGKNIAKLAKILIKYKIKNIRSRLG
ncbi:MAG TPA: NAD(P)/FAD-dependent oxidoreductase [archaeon]|nr:NAD(P)/FAD-dependent oxidoreductase [archaeon]